MSNFYVQEAIGEVVQHFITGDEAEYKIREAILKELEPYIGDDFDIARRIIKNGK